MRRFVLGWKALGYERRLEARVVNYADDFVICCRGTAERGEAGHSGNGRWTTRRGRHRKVRAAIGAAGPARHRATTRLYPRGCPPSAVEGRGKQLACATL